MFTRSVVYPVQQSVTSLNTREPVLFLEEAVRGQRMKNNKNDINVNLINFFLIQIGENCRRNVLLRISNRGTCHPWRSRCRFSGRDEKSAKIRRARIYKLDLILPVSDLFFPSRLTAPWPPRICWYLFFVFRFACNQLS